MTADRPPLEEFRDAFTEVTAGSGGAVQIAEIALGAQVNLRIAPRDTALWADVLGVAPPAEPNTLAPTRDGWIAWLGPDEWLLVSSSDLRATVQRLRGAARQVHASIVDVSAARAALHIGGVGARDLLAHGCALDLHPREFRAGRCAQTRLALANVIIAAPPDGQSDFDAAPAYTVLVGTSFARYLAGWLCDAATDAAAG